MIILCLNLNKKLKGQTGNDGTKDDQIMLLLKYLSNLWITLKMTLINCETNIFLTWSSICFIVAGTVNNQIPTFAITDKKRYVPVMTLSAQDDDELLKQLKTGLKRTINRNRYQSEPALQAQNCFLNYLIDLNFQGVNRLFFCII